MLSPPLALRRTTLGLERGSANMVERRKWIGRTRGGNAMAQQRAKPALNTVDPVWTRIRHEAEDIVRNEPELATFIYSTILHHETLEAAIIYRLAERLDHPALSGGVVRAGHCEGLKGH